MVKINSIRLLQNPRFHLGLFTFNPYGVDIVKRITPAASCFHPGETWDNPDRG